MSDAADFPNLFVIGAMKSGTTSLHDYLASHPDIHMSAVKEPNYWTKASPAPSETQEYCNLMAPGRHMRYRGESSTQYTKQPRISGVVRRIAVSCPDARFVYLMRDPVERTLSHYWFAYRKKDERRSLEEALRGEPDYIDVSYYAMQLRPYLETFSSQCVYPMTLESLRDDPTKSLARLFQWLGLPQTIDPHVLTRRANVTPQELLSIRRSSTLYRLLRSRTWRNVGRSAIPSNLRRRIRQNLTVATTDVDTASRRSIQYLRSIQVAQVAELSALIDRDFPEWKTLHGTS